MSKAEALEEFRTSVQEWLKDNVPASLKGKSMSGEGEMPGGPDFNTWRDALAEKGWGTPTWPKEYGGAGLSHPEAKVIDQEIGRAGVFNPIPNLALMGVTMVGPTILEYGTEEQKKKHLPAIASGKVAWCLGLSEPGAGSDLASLSTKAVEKDGEYVVNGQKIWTSGAHYAHWCGALVRTDPSAAKRDGISFVMFKMDQPGVSTKPIQLISGASPFCETFFDDAKADKSDLLGELNDGWSVIKRLLQHERQSQTGAPSAGGSGNAPKIQDMAKEYVGTNADGSLADPDLRGRLTKLLMDEQAHKLTVGRIVAEAKGEVKVSAAASILKNSMTNVAQTKAELTMEFMGSQGIGWEGDFFTKEELGNVQSWLAGKAMSIYGGSYEVQNNIISKNILGLPETTQKG